MKNLILSTEPNKSYLLIRVMVGFFFFVGGVLKFSFPELQEPGFYRVFGSSFAETFAFTVALLETICGLMILGGLFTRVAVIPLLLAILITVFAGKIPIIFEEGFWLMAHISRIDFAMFLGGVFLLINGSGALSVDLKMQAGKTSSSQW